MTEASDFHREWARIPVLGDTAARGIVILEMASRLRIGLFPYLNVQLLVHGLRTETDVEVVLDLPSRIADRFRLDELDLAMVPSLEAATLQAPILNSVSISSEGAVETVILHHRVPLDRVKTLAADEASRTSVALAKILIAQASGRLPASTMFSPSGPLPKDADAALVIGDPAFNWRRDGYEPLDLGEAWQRLTALPFVFAVMVRSPRVSATDLDDRMGRALRRGLNATSAIARSYDARIDPARAERYLRHVIHYDLGEREKEGLALFHRLARQSGLLAPAKELEFHAI